MWYFSSVTHHILWFMYFMNVPKSKYVLCLNSSARLCYQIYKQSKTLSLVATSPPPFIFCSFVVVLSLSFCLIMYFTYPLETNLRLSVELKLLHKALALGWIDSAPLFIRPWQISTYWVFHLRVAAPSRNASQWCYICGKDTMKKSMCVAPSAWTKWVWRSGCNAQPVVFFFPLFTDPELWTVISLWNIDGYMSQIDKNIRITVHWINIL